MDEQNKSVGERWGRPADPGERGYAGEMRDDRTSEIRSDIEHTRAEMSETVDAIQDRLRPGNVVSRAAESVRDATVGRATEFARGARQSFERPRHSGDGGFVDRLRENPIPAALAAGSMAWLAFATRSSRPRSMPAIYGSTRGGQPFVEEGTISSDVDIAYNQEYYETDPYGSSTPGPAGRLPSMARGTGQRLRRATRSTQNGLQRMVQENPLAVGAMAAAVGAMIGLALPETERENEMMGEARQSMVDRAKDAAHEAAGRVQEAAQAAQKVATEVVTGTSRDQT